MKQVVYVHPGDEIAMYEHTRIIEIGLDVDTKKLKIAFEGKGDRVLMMLSRKYIDGAIELARFTLFEETLYICKFHKERWGELILVMGRTVKLPERMYDITTTPLSSPNAVKMRYRYITNTKNRKYQIQANEKLYHGDIAVNNQFKLFPVIR